MDNVRFEFLLKQRTRQVREPDGRTSGLAFFMKKFCVLKRQEPERIMNEIKVLNRIIFEDKYVPEVR